MTDPEFRPDLALSLVRAASGPAPGALQTLVVQSAGGIVVVLVRGELDIGTAPELSRQLFDLLDAPLTGLTVNCAEVAFIDSSGIAAFAATKRQADGRGIAFELDEVPPLMQRAFEITGMDSFLGIRKRDGGPSDTDLDATRS
jgi:anti-sigma B factor antagonist